MRSKAVKHDKNEGAFRDHLTFVHLSLKQIRILRDLVRDFGHEDLLIHKEILDELNYHLRDAEEVKS